MKSTAILFGEADRLIILTLQGLALLCLAMAGRASAWASGSLLGLLGAAACFAWEFWSTRGRTAGLLRRLPAQPLGGLAILLGIVVDYALR